MHRIVCEVYTLFTYFSAVVENLLLQAALFIGLAHICNLGESTTSSCTISCVRVKRHRRGYRYITAI